MTAELKPVHFARKGQLVVNSRGKLYRVDRILSSVNYLVTDEDGKQYKLRRDYTYEAPEGAVFAGPEGSAFDERRAERAKAADEFNVGDVVEMANEKDKARFPGTYLITKRTSATRFKLQQVGGTIGLTSPAGLIKKV